MLLAALLTACAPGAISPPTATPASGIEGQVFIGPTCPVESPTSPCPDSPFQTGLTIRDTQSRQVAQFTTDASGRFRVSLPPGQYVILPEDIKPGTRGAVPTGEPFAVTVSPGKYTQVIITYDSGIR